MSGDGFTAGTSDGHVGVAVVFQLTLNYFGQAVSVAKDVAVNLRALVQHLTWMCKVDCEVGGCSAVEGVQVICKSIIINIAECIGGNGIFGKKDGYMQYPR